MQRTCHVGIRAELTTEAELSQEVLLEDLAQQDPPAQARALSSRSVSASHHRMLCPVQHEPRPDPDTLTELPNALAMRKRNLHQTHTEALPSAKRIPGFIDIPGQAVAPPCGLLPMHDTVETTLSDS